MYYRNILTALTLSVALTGAAPATRSQWKRDDSLKFAYGSEKVRGVNIGGWLVLESWITPSIFEPFKGDGVVDEWTLTSHLGKDAAGKLLQQHWSSWITEDDFAQIAANKLNHVRIPIGYWSIPKSNDPSDPYVMGAYKYFGQALDWAQTHGLKVLVDIHGAQGSQNGFDNSGHNGSVQWTDNDGYITNTKTALNQIRDDYASHPALAAIELINEPLGSDLDMNKVNQFYYDGWGDLQNSNVAITFHDAFQGVNSWNNFGAGMWNLMEDTHHYEVFDSGSLAMSPSEHTSTACGFGDQMASNNKWTIAGEWTGALTDCAQYLNGFQIGSRYDGTYQLGSGSSYIGSCQGKDVGTVEGMLQADKDNIQTFVAAQLDAYEKAAGWIFWCWKTESAPEWHLQNLTAAGLFPKDPANRPATLPDGSSGHPCS